MLPQYDERNADVALLGPRHPAPSGRAGDRPRSTCGGAGWRRGRGNGLRLDGGRVLACAGAPVVHPVEDHAHVREPEQLRQVGAQLGGPPWRSSPRAPRGTARWTPRGPRTDSAENGLSGEVGSAAVLKNVAANAWYGALTSMPACSTPRSRAAKSVSVASTRRPRACGARPASPSRTPGSGVPWSRSSSTRCRPRRPPPARSARIVVWAYPRSRNSRIAVSRMSCRVCSPRGRTPSAESRSSAQSGPSSRPPYWSSSRVRSRTAAAAATDAAGHRQQVRLGEAVGELAVAGQRPEAGQPGAVADVHLAGVGHDGDVAQGRVVVQAAGTGAGRGRSGRDELQRYELGARLQPAAGPPGTAGSRRRRGRQRRGSRPRPPRDAARPSCGTHGAVPWPAAPAAAARRHRPLGAEPDAGRPDVRRAAPDRASTPGASAHRARRGTARWVGGGIGSRPAGGSGGVGLRAGAAGCGGTG